MRTKIWVATLAILSGCSEEPNLPAPNESSCKIGSLAFIKKEQHQKFIDSCEEIGIQVKNKDW